MKWIFAAVLTGALILSGWMVSDLRAQDKEEMSSEDIQRLQQGIALHEKELKDFYGLIDQLEFVAEQSSNAGRREAINELKESMVRIILDLEKRVGRIHVIQEHGTPPRYTEDRKEVSGNTLPMTGKAYQNSYRTGGTGGKPWLARLTQMQGIYRVCKTAREPAISKHERALPYYISKVKEFAMLMELNIWEASAMLPEDGDKEKPAVKSAERKSKYE